MSELRRSASRRMGVRSVMAVLAMTAVTAACGLLTAAGAGAAAAGMGMGMGHTTNAFKGVKVNGGTVTHSKQGARNVLTLSDDFKVPDTPAPHWQVVDSKGNVYLLQRLKVKDDKYNKSITLPAYIPDVARVQIWCSWAEALLGEAAFESPMR
jgi:hypothetical protein